MTPLPAGVGLLLSYIVLCEHIPDWKINTLKSAIALSSPPRQQDFLSFILREDHVKGWILYFEEAGILRRAHICEDGDTLWVSGQESSAFHSPNFSFYL